MYCYKALGLVNLFPPGCFHLIYVNCFESCSKAETLRPCCSRICKPFIKMFKNNTKSRKILIFNRTIETLFSLPFLFWFINLNVAEGNIFHPVLSFE